ncbi:MAG: DUF2334 domain-containing protein [Syntrophales bacterium]
MNEIPFAFLPPKLIRGLHRYAFPYLGERLYVTHDQLSNLREGSPSFLIRVDDFPRWDADTKLFERFHDVFLKHNVSYVLGVTPFLNFAGDKPRFINDSEIVLLRQMAGDGVELAVHGFTHEYRVAPYRHPCETFFYSADQLCDSIDRANGWFREHGLPKPTHFIPAFNTFSRRDFDILTKSYRVFHGGPLSLTTFGKYGPSRLEEEDALYLPSFEPFYNQARKVLQALTIGKRHFRHRVLYSIALHWAWEIESDFQHVEELLVVLKDNGWTFDVAALNGWPKA